MIESSEEIRIDDKPLAKKNLETKDSEDMEIGVTESPDEKRIDDKPVSVKDLKRHQQKTNLWLRRTFRTRSYKISQMKLPTEVKPLFKSLKRNEEDKPIAKKSFEIKESEDKEIYGDPFPNRYQTTGPLMRVQ